MIINQWDTLYVFPNWNKYIKCKVKRITARWEIQINSWDIIKISKMNSFYWVYYYHNKYTLEAYFHIILKNKWLYPLANIIEIIKFKMEKWLPRKK